MRASGIALVTGANRGIGRAVALELARRGFDVLATARRPELAADLPSAASPGRLRVDALDVTRPETIRIPDALRVLVNNAGIEPEYLPVEHAPLEAWRAIFDTNVFGLLEVTRRAIPKLRAAGGGVVCNITTSSLLAPVPFYAAYRASKAAVSAIGESLRAELAPFGIRVVEILPGPIRTDMLARSDRVPEAARFPEYAEMARRAFAGRQSVEARVAEPEQAAAAIVDAILDDAAPLRHGCDAISRGLLEAWRGSSDEALMRGMLPAFVGAAPGEAGPRG